MQMKNMLKNPYVKNILSALAIVFGGSILLNLTFLFDFLFQSLVDEIIKLFTSVDFNMAWSWLPPVKHGIFVILIGSISWFIFKSKLPKLIKAIYLTVPTAVVLATIGIFFYQWQLLPFVLGGIAVLGTLYFFYKKRLPWVYWFAVIIVALALLVMTLTGQEI